MGNRTGAVNVFEEGKIVLGRMCPSCRREFPAAGEEGVCPFDNTLLSLMTGDPLIGQVIADKYEVIEQIGRGGWSVVYKARQASLKRLVSLKILHSHLVCDPEKVMRFQREAEAASQIIHENVAAVFDYGVLPQGQPYIVMEYLEGSSLAQLVEMRGGRLPLEELTPMILQACNGLAAAHERGVVHRDIKPSNLFIVSKTGMLKILDFGLAKLVSEKEGFTNLSQTGETLGTPTYMSPEQCTGYELDQRSDIYSLGCVIYEAICGAPPFLGRNAFECMNRHVNDHRLRFPLSRAPSWCLTRWKRWSCAL